MSDFNPESAPKQTLIACQTYGERKSGTSLPQGRKAALSAARCLSLGPPATNEKILEDELPSRHYRVLFADQWPFDDTAGHRRLGSTARKMAVERVEDA
jgi:hypothetical protein